MIIKSNEPEDKVSIGETTTFTSGIAAENTGLALKMVSKNMYSNPIGSFIREITSNAVDSNIDADSDGNVIVHFYKEKDFAYIEFKDTGTGMSPELFNNIYMQWFSSTRRGSNQGIGGWGLGSKSPLSYQPNFEITTRSEGMEYHYIYSEGVGNNLPTSDLIFSKETTECNGTTIRVEVKLDDIYKVSEELNIQLSYFNKVYVKNDISYFNNNFKIYDSEHYRLKNTSRPYGEYMHISLGQVTYPIDWNVMGLAPIRIPVALRFETGDLDVILNREAINYTDSSIKAIIDKIDLVTDDLLEKYNEQLRFEDLLKYIKAVEGKSRPMFTIKDVEINMSDYDIKPTFVPFSNYTIVKKYLSSLFCMYSVRDLSKAKVEEKSDPLTTDYLTNSYMNLLFVSDRVNIYDSTYNQNGSLVNRSKLNKRHIYKLSKLLGLIESEEGYENTIYKTGHIAIISKVVKFIDNFVISYCKSYNCAPDYWIENYKQEQRQLQSDRKESITWYDFDATREKSTYGKLEEKYKYIFYMNKDGDTKENVAYKGLYNLIPNHFKSVSTFILIKPSVCNKVKNKKNFIDAKNLIKINEFKSSFQRLLYYKRFKIFESKCDVNLLIYSDYYYNLYKYMSESFNKSYETRENCRNNMSEYHNQVYVDLVDYFGEQLNKIKVKPNRISIDKLNRADEVLDFIKKVDIIQYLSYNIPHNYKADILRRLGVLKINTKHLIIKNE